MVETLFLALAILRHLMKELNIISKIISPPTDDVTDRYSQVIISH